MIYLTVRQFADQEQLHPDTVYAAIAAKRLPCKRHGRSIRIASDAVIAPLQKPATKPTATKKPAPTPTVKQSKGWYFQQPGYDIKKGVQP